MKVKYDHRGVPLDKADFYEAVYKIVARIPAGKVMTYGQIGFMLGSSYYARRVGYAMKNSPKSLNLPCHRVVNSKGELAPSHVFGGRGRQREILNKEGVIFLENGNIDLRKSLYIF